MVSMDLERALAFIGPIYLMDIEKRKREGQELTICYSFQKRTAPQQSKHQLPDRGVNIEHTVQGGATSENSIEETIVDSSQTVPHLG